MFTQWSADTASSIFFISFNIMSSLLTRVGDPFVDLNSR